MGLRRGLVLAAGLLLGLPVAAQDAIGWLARMAEAVRDLDYQGDLVYAHADQIETLRLFHAAGPDGERERLVTLSGSPREVIRDRGRVVCICTGTEASAYDLSTASPRLVGVVPADPARLQQHYVLQLGGIERVAEHQAQLLEIRPRDAFRYGYRLWLERGSGMPLKSVRFGVDGRAIEQLMFTRITLGQRPSDADLAGSSALGPAPAATSVPGGARVPGWTVLDPPPGFLLSPQQPVPQVVGEHLVYSDGIAHVSVYVEALTGEAPAFSGPASRGAVNLYGRIVQGRQVTVLGEVPAATVERFARGVAAAGGG